MNEVKMLEQRAEFVRFRIEEYNKELRDIYDKIERLQAECLHPRVETKVVVDEGFGADHTFTENYCPDCDKFWIKEG